jgi:hypothetical protein
VASIHDRSICPCAKPDPWATNAIRKKIGREVQLMDAGQVVRNIAGIEDYCQMRASR